MIKLFKRLQPITLRDACSKVMLYHLTEFLKDGDLRWFTEQHRMVDGLEQVMSNVFSEYAELTENNSILSRFATIFKIMRLQTKYDDVNMLIDAAMNYPNIDDIEPFKALLDRIEAWKYKINRLGDVFSQIEAIRNRSQSIKTEIALLQEKLAKEDEKEAVSIEAQLLSVERALDMRYPIDQKITSLVRWAELQKQAKAK